LAQETTDAPPRWAAIAALTPTAGTTLIYVKGGFPTTSAKNLKPESVWAAHDDRFTGGE